MNVLSKIGIQQWRLREPLSAHSVDLGAGYSAGDSAEATVADQDAEFAQEALSPEALPNAELLLEGLDWAGLNSWLAEGNCKSCSQGGAILGEGDNQADWMFLLDAPNAEALKQESVIGGRARSLYQAILTALKLNIEQVYTTSLFKCAPSLDKMLTTACQEILARQVALLNPKVIVCLGEFCGQALVKSNDSLASMRKQEFRCLHSKAPVIVSHSLTDLLHSPKLKAQAWQDFKRAKKAVR